MPRIVANGLSIHYQQQGQGEDLVLIHGLTGNLSTWYLHVMPALAERFRVTAYDLRGHGYSELTSKGYTSVDFAADLDGLLEGLRIERAHLVGYSFGATVALHCAALYPSRVASLVLAEPWISALQPLVDLAKWPYRELARARFRARGLDIPEDKWFDLDFVLREAVQAHRERRGEAFEGDPVRFRLEGGGKSDSQPNELWRSLVEHWFPPGRRLLRLMDDTTALKEALEIAGLTLEAIGRVRQLTLAIYGERSPFLQVAPTLRSAMPRCQVSVLEGVGHYFAVASPELLVAAVLKFLDENVADGGDELPMYVGESVAGSGAS